MLDLGGEIYSRVDFRPATGRAKRGRLTGELKDINEVLKQGLNAIRIRKAILAREFKLAFVSTD